MNSPTVVGLQTQRSQQVDQVADYLLSRAALLVRLLVKQVRNTEITRTEGEVLIILSDAPRRITELAELEGVAQPTMTALVKRLEGNRWVRRDGLAGDGRVVMVTITAAGSAALEVFRAEFLKAMRTDLEGLSDAELEALAQATETLGSFVDVLQQRV